MNRQNPLIGCMLFNKQLYVHVPAAEDDAYRAKRSRASPGRGSSKDSEYDRWEKELVKEKCRATFTNLFPPQVGAIRRERNT